jgi:hypothetical protein
MFSTSAAFFYPGGNSSSGGVNSSGLGLNKVIVTPLEDQLSEKDKNLKNLLPENEELEEVNRNDGSFYIIYENHQKDLLVKAILSKIE